MEPVYVCTVCLSVRLPTAFRRQEGRQQQGGGGGKEVAAALTSSNVWLSLLETPSWAAPPLPFLSLSLKHVPSKPLSADTPSGSKPRSAAKKADIS